MSYLFKNKKIIFIHIPKNAGTSVYLSLKEHNDSVSLLIRRHSTALEIRKKFSHLWDECFKFCIVRNPWDRVVSCYEFARMEKSYYHAKNRKHLDYDFLVDKTFEETLNILDKTPDKLKHEGWGPQNNYICDEDGKNMMDKVFYYENLKKDKEFNDLVPGINWENSSNHENYKRYYQSISRINIVKRVYSKDIKMFKYHDNNLTSIINKLL